MGQYSEYREETRVIWVKLDSLRLPKNVSDKVEMMREDLKRAMENHVDRSELEQKTEALGQLLKEIGRSVNKGS